jgi:hypothetical protein
MQIKFDPRFLRLNDVTAGDFLAQGAQPEFSKNIQNDSGQATLQIARPAGSPGVSGMGVLVNLVFQAVTRGATSVQITNLSVTNSQGQVVASSIVPLNVGIR